MHRDSEPENILGATGTVKIADFGMCCHTSDKDDMKKVLHSIPSIRASLGDPIYYENGKQKLWNSKTA